MKCSIRQHWVSNSLVISFPDRLSGFIYSLQKDAWVVTFTFIIPVDIV